MPENKVFSHLAIKVMFGQDPGWLVVCLGAFRLLGRNMFSDLTGRELMLRIWQLHKGELHSSVANLTLGAA